MITNCNLQSITQAPIIHVGDSFNLFGGDYGLEDGKKIGRLSIEMRRWSSAGSLATGRHGSNAIYDGQYVLVVGGFRDMKTEKCSISSGRVTCATQLPELYDYFKNPEVFPASFGFCKQL